jgi:hypothetical protein
MFRYCHITKIRQRSHITIRILSLCQANLRYERALLMPSDENGIAGS